jgi:3-methyladenine DNA glycosylase AlkD
MTRPTRLSVSRRLHALARPAGAFDAARYFRGDSGLRFHNVGATAVRALAREIHLDTREAWSVSDAMRLAESLMRDPYLETKGVAIELLSRYRRAFTPRLLPVWKRWLASDLAANWATTDLMCGRLIGPLLADHPSLIGTMHGWARHRNRWVRRASAVSLIPPMREGLALDDAYAVATLLRGDEDDLIQKAVGWMLREAGRRDQRRLARYLRTNGQTIPRTTVRYAIERFPPRARAALLASTRPVSAAAGAR